MTEINKLPSLLSSVRAYYRFESGALTTDSSGNGYTLTNNNSVGEITGKYGGGADFGTTNTNKSFRINSTLGITDTQAITINKWIKMRNEIGSGSQVFVEKVNSNGSILAALSMRYDYNSGTRRVVFRRNGSSDVTINHTVTLGTTDFHLLTLTYNGSNTLQGYFDGVFVNSAAASGTLSVGGYTDQFSIGATNSTDNTNFASIIADDTSVFPSVLSSDDIATIFEDKLFFSGNPMFFSGGVTIG